jgi:DNA-directed RNA polymerase alpha subunit
MLGTNPGHEHDDGVKEETTKHIANAKSQTCELKQDAENRILAPKQEEGEESGGESQSGKETFQYKLKRAVQGRAPANIVQRWPR